MTIILQWKNLVVFSSVPKVDDHGIIQNWVRWMNLAPFDSSSPLPSPNC